MDYVHTLIGLLEVRLPHTSSIITIRQILGTPVYKSFIPTLKSEAFSCNRIAEYGYLLDETSGFLVEQVIPVAKGVLNASSVKRVIISDSLAGLAATYTTAKYPEAFHYALIQSPAYWYKYEQGKLSNALAQASLAGHRVYIHHGVFEGEEFTSIIENVASILRERGASIEVAKTNQGHSWGQWREYLGYGLIKLLATA